MTTLSSPSPTMLQEPAQLLEMDADDWVTVLREAQLKKFTDGEVVMKVSRLLFFSDSFFSRKERVVALFTKSQQAA